MSECYKCGRTLAADQVECDPPCFGNQPEDHDYEEAVTEYMAKTVPVDWDKVKTIEDLKLVLKTLAVHDRVQRGSEEFHLLRHLLKESNVND